MVISLGVWPCVGSRLLLKSRTPSPGGGVGRHPPAPPRRGAGFSHVRLNFFLPVFCAAGKILLKMTPAQKCTPSPPGRSGDHARVPPRSPPPRGRKRTLVGSFVSHISKILQSLPPNALSCKLRSHSLSKLSMLLNVSTLACDTRCTTCCA